MMIPWYVQHVVIREQGTLLKRVAKAKAAAIRTSRCTFFMTILCLRILSLFLSDTSSFSPPAVRSALLVQYRTFWLVVVNLLLYGT